MKENKKKQKVAARKTHLLYIMMRQLISSDKAFLILNTQPIAIREHDNMHQTTRSYAMNEFNIYFEFCCQYGIDFMIQKYMISFFLIQNS